MKSSPTYHSAHAQIKKWVFPFWFLGNGFGLGIILNDFWNSTIWDVQIQDSFTEWKILWNLGIQNTYGPYMIWGEFRNISILKKIKGHNFIMISILEWQIELKKSKILKFSKFSRKMSHINRTVRRSLVKNLPRFLLIILNLHFCIDIGLIHI